MSQGRGPDGTQNQWNRERRQTDGDGSHGLSLGRFRDWGRCHVDATTRFQPRLAVRSHSRLFRSPGAWLLGAILLMGLSAPGCAPQAPAPELSTLESRIGRYGAWAAVPDGPPPNIILLSLDTTRRDHLSCYRRSGPAVTPHLDALAADGVLFERAKSPTPLTLPSHATMMTGLWPYRHAVRNNGTHVLGPDKQTFAEILRERGYATGAIVGAFPVAAQFGLNQGFDTYDDAFLEAGGVNENDAAQRRAAEVTGLGLDWVREHRQGPFLLWLHYFDPHFPYDPPEPYRSAHPADPYLGEIAYMDAQIGLFLDGLREMGVLDRTAVVVAADHGESRGEHGEGTHGYFIYGATQDVPLLLRLPETGPWREAAWRGRRVDALVSLADIFPTILNLAGVADEARPPCHGLSLLPVAAGDAPGRSWVYLESLAPKLEHGLAELRALETERWKYIRAPQPELYDRAADPGELQNRVTGERRVVGALTASLEQVIKKDAGGDAGQVAMDAETAERLRSLGYLGAGMATVRPGEPIDPKLMIDALRRIDVARALSAERRYPAALAVIDSVLAEHANDQTALRMKGSLLVQMGRGGEALAAFDQLIAVHGGRVPDELEVRQLRATAALLAGRTDEALKIARALAVSEPEREGIHLLVGTILRRQGDLPGARRAIEEQVRRTPQATEPLIGLAELEIAARNPAAAEALYRRALDLEPDAAEALVGLGELQLARGQGREARASFEGALEADPHLPQALFRKAWFLRQDGRVDEALACYQGALARAPGNPTILYNIGNIYLEQERLAEAVGAYEAAARIHERLPGLLYNLGTAHARMGNMESARTIWRRALEITPTVADGKTDPQRERLEALLRDS